MKRILLCLLCVVSLVAMRAAGNSPFEVGRYTFLLHGEPFVVKAAELHYPRIPQPYWEHRIEMCRALGMNTICLYVFWNYHEQQEGVYDFTGQRDIAAFCRMAQEHGMYVIVRPGPYVCAEWEMGGLPWWLLKKKDIALRESDPYFMERVERFMMQVGEQLAPLTIANGGPIIMVQVENEYGSYGEDKAYVREIANIVRRAGFDDVTLFQCDWSTNFSLNGLDELLWTMNFGAGANIDEQFRELRELRPTTPLMCSEYWSGWFDKWGARHETRPAADMVQGIAHMLQRGISFSLYMTHGGTSFGHWAGANSPGFAPDVTSYDYDAPINEYGYPTEKYFMLREMMQHYAGEPLPHVPEPAAPIIAVDEFYPTEHAPLWMGVDSVAHGQLLTFEEMNMGWGQMIYLTRLPALPQGGSVEFEGCHDYARIFIDGRFVGSVNRVVNENSLQLPPAREGAVMEVLVEGMGRINFGRAINDRKGLVGAAIVSYPSPTGVKRFPLDEWTMMRITDHYATACRALDNATTRAYEQAGGAGGEMVHAGYYRGYFNIDKPGDTFLNMSQWGKGQLYVNGHAVGRFWNIGPQQTLYVPGCWLHEGRNEVVVLDVIGPQAISIRGEREHRLDSLNVSRSEQQKEAPRLDRLAPVAVGTLAATHSWQQCDVKPATRGRYVAIVCDGTPALAELNVLDENGARIGKDEWRATYVSSDDAAGGNHTAEKAFDLQETTYWRPATHVAAPHLMVIDMRYEHTVSAVQCMPAAGSSAAGYKIYVY